MANSSNDKLQDLLAGRLFHVSDLQEYLRSWFLFMKEK